MCIDKKQNLKNMKECGNSKIHISSNFILSISLLIMFDTLLLRPSLNCNTSPHFTQLHFTTLRYTSPHFMQLHFTTLIDTSLPLIYTSLPFHLALRIYISYRSIFILLRQTHITIAHVDFGLYISETSNPSSL